MILKYQVIKQANRRSGQIILMYHQLKLELAIKAQFTGAKDKNNSISSAVVHNRAKLFTTLNNNSILMKTILMWLQANND